VHLYTVDARASRCEVRAVSGHGLAREVGTDVLGGGRHRKVEDDVGMQRPASGGGGRRREAEADVGRRQRCSGVRDAGEKEMLWGPSIPLYV
jgi:hypothetical protein